MDSIRAEVQAMDAYLKAVLENSSWDEQTKLRDSFTVLRKKSDEELKKLRAAIVGELNVTVDETRSRPIRRFFSAASAPESPRRAAVALLALRPKSSRLPRFYRGDRVRHSKLTTQRGVLWHAQNLIRFRAGSPPEF